MDKHAKGLYSILGEGTICEGTLTVPHNLHIDGKFKGVIQVAELVTIGPSADVEADIKATSAIIGGTIKGNVHVSKRLELEEKAVLFGNLKARELVINEGAMFHGNCSMKEESIP